MSLSIFETHSDTLVNQYWVPHLIWAKGKYWKYHHDISGIVRVNLELGGTTATTTKAAASSGACGGSNVDGDFKCMIEVANDIRLRWTPPSAAWTTIRLKVETSGSKYVSFGLGSQMKGSDVVVAYPDYATLGTLMTSSYHLDSYRSPSDGSCGKDGSTCPFSEMEAVQTRSGVSVVATVTRSAVTKSIIGSDETISMIFARGDMWKGKHSVRSSSIVNVASGTATKVKGPKYDMHLLHGALMIVAWLVLAPTASLVARALRFGLLAAPNWFNTHWVLHTIASLLFLWAVIMAITRFDSQNIPNGHKEIGLAMIALWAAQVMLGLLRPDKHGEVRFGFVQPSWRPQFQIAHRVLAAVCLACAMSNCVTGATRFKELYDEQELLVASYALVAAYVVAWLVCEAAGLPSKGRDDDKEANASAGTTELSSSKTAEKDRFPEGHIKV